MSRLPGSTLTLALSLSYTTFAALLPLLPLLFQHTSQISFALSAFIFPSLFLHPLLSNISLFPPVPLIQFASFVQACAPLLLSLAFSKLLHHNLRILISIFAIFTAGLATSAFQSGLLLQTFHSDTHSTARHLAILSLCISIFAIPSPPLFTYIVSRTFLWTPFLISGLLQLILAFYISFTINIPNQLPEAHPLLHQTIQTYLTQAHSSKPSNPRLFQPFTSLFKNPSLSIVVFSTLVSAASSAFLRPILTSYVTDTLGKSRIFAASLFSLSAFVAVLAECLVAYVAGSVNSRKVTVFGMLLSLAACLLFRFPIFIFLAVSAIVTGSSCSLVVAVSDLAEVMDEEVTVAGSVSRLAAFLFAIGEIFGMVTAGLMNDMWGFEVAMMYWGVFLGVAVVAVVGTGAVQSLVARNSTSSGGRGEEESSITDEVLSV